MTGDELAEAVFDWLTTNVDPAIKKQPIQLGKNIKELRSIDLFRIAAATCRPKHLIRSLLHYRLLVRCCVGLVNVHWRRPLLPLSWSPKVSLHSLFVNCHHPQHLTTYSSDPILTFGAAQVWHRYEVLDKLMLPQLRQYIVEEMFGMKLGDKTCRSVVTRVLLLLAMDMCGSEHLFTIDPYTEDYMRVYEENFFLSCPS